MKRFISLSLSLLLAFCLLAPALSFSETASRVLILYWDGDAPLETSDVWAWMPGKDGKGYLFTACDYGARCEIHVPADAAEVGFIVRTGCSDPGGSSWGEASKDFSDDRFAVLTGDITEVWLKTGESQQYRSADGGKTLDPIRFFKSASIVSPTEIKYTVAPAARFESMDQIAVYDGDRQVEIEKVSSLGNNVIIGTVTVKEPLDVTRNYELELDGFGRKPMIPTDIFDSEAFIAEYTYDGDDLGAVIHGDETVFKLWAPTASRVLLNLFDAGDGCEARESLEMILREKGVWELTVPCGTGTYYTYTVTTAAGTQEAVDPYAKALGVNGDRGMVIDLNTTDPEGFDRDTWFSGISTYEDAVIWEVHVRDFSIADKASSYPGKYLAFTETGLTNAAGYSTGIDHVAELGATHIHLQPVYDYATVDETDPDGSYNWGYDPKNYNAPEGSYSTDPYHGEVRINEFKQMVQAIHRQGMGVVMDVVYNHTADANSNLNRIVPYYYYRYTATGENSNGSGCGNETASDRVMFRKYMADSVTYWAKEYHIDGFRFDLMALHDLETMQEIEQKLHALNPQCLIYGEGWTGGTSALFPAKQVTQANIARIVPSENAAGGIAVFNDSIRDGLKGSVFNAKETGYVSGAASKMNAWKVIFGLTGGVSNVSTSWKALNAGVINYTACHDNMTLWDKLLASNPDQSDTERIGMIRMASAAVLLSRGTPFLLAGEEMLRTKQGDSNSYMSSDEINHLDWESLTDGSPVAETFDYYRQLIRLRKETGFLRSAPVTCELGDNMAILATWTGEKDPVGFAVFNPGGGSVTVSLPEGVTELRFAGIPAGTESVPAGADGTVTVPGMSWCLFGRPEP